MTQKKSVPSSSAPELSPVALVIGAHCRVEQLVDNCWQIDYPYELTRSAWLSACATCDASVSLALSYDVEPEMHRLRGGRSDGALGL